MRIDNKLRTLYIDGNITEIEYSEIRAIMAKVAMQGFECFVALNSTPANNEYINLIFQDFSYTRFEESTPPERFDDCMSKIKGVIFYLNKIGKPVRQFKLIFDMEVVTSISKEKYSGNRITMIVQFSLGQENEIKEKLSEITNDKIRDLTPGAKLLIST